MKFLQAALQMNARLYIQDLCLVMVL